VLLDDAHRYVERAAAGGADARLDIWMEMPHGFVTGVGKDSAACIALNAVGKFFAERLDERRENPHKAYKVGRRARS
jgi:epsilon-lactone hydrolase